MSEEYFSISADRFRNLVSLTLKGFWSIEIFDTYVEKLQASISRNWPNPEARLKMKVLADIRQFDVQTLEIVERFELFNKAQGNEVYRVATVAPAAALLMMQSKRIVIPEAHRFFVSVEDALQWLFEGA